MPELPDVTVYVECLRRRVIGTTLERVRLGSPFVLRSVEPTLDDVADHVVRDVRRLGKRIVIGLDEALFVIIHLMVAGRLRWRERGKAIPKRFGLAAFDFASGTLLFTEAGTQKRASLHVARGQAALREFDRGGLEVLESSAAEFRTALTRERHTLKRALTDPRLFSGIGNAYSDEILHAARLSPLQLTKNLSDAEVNRLFEQTGAVLKAWTARLRDDVGTGFPDKVTAFREGMAVHGRYGKPCPTCETTVQRIRYATTEVNYCPRCQTGGRMLADRSLSRLLKGDWPKTVEEWEEPRPP
jgi:formamidopyrimidine-DNA glycosylase